MPTILLADDSVTIRRVIELTFADEGVRVIAVADGEQAIARLDADPPDIVLADVGMPKVDGYAVATYVKQSPSLRHIPVLLLTGAFEPIDEPQARATGCDGVLVKPFEPQLLVTRVRELLSGQHSPALWPADLPRAESRGRAPAAVVPVAAPAAPLAPLAPLTPPAPPPSQPPRTARVFEPAASAAAPPPSQPPRMDRLLEPAASAAVPKARPAFEAAMDQLDEAFAMLEPSAPPAELDHKSASEFARDLHELRGALSDEPASSVPSEWTRAMPTPAETAGSAPGDSAALSRVPVDFGDWDIPASVADTLPAPPPVIVPKTVAPEPVVTPPAPVAAAPVPVVAAAPAAVVARPTPVVGAPASGSEASVPAKVSLANAFSALLAAEQLHPTYRAPIATPAISEAAIEEVVRRVLMRMTDEIVHKTVLDAAERLIREEIDRIKAKPDH